MIRRRFLVVLLALALGVGGFVQPHTVFADCLTPIPTATPIPSYATTLIAISPSHLIASWKLDESGGTTAADSSGNGRSGTYSGPTLNAITWLDGSPAPSFDGVNDNVNVYSTSFASAINFNEFTISVWLKPDSTFLSSTTGGLLFYFGDAALTNAIQITKNSSANSFLFTRTAVSGTKTQTVSDSSTSWTHFALTGSVSSGNMISYINGTSAGTQTGLAYQSMTLGSARAVIGARNTSGLSPWTGNIAELAIWDTTLTSGDISTLATGPSISPTATPQPTCTPSPTLTPTITPSMSPTFTSTPTLTPSPTSTLDLYTYVTVIPPGGGFSDAALGALKHEASLGQFMIAFILFAILMVAIFDLIMKRRGR